MYHSLIVRPVIVILRSILMTVCLIGGAIAAGPVPADPVPFHIGQQPLRLALTEFARQSDRELLFSTDVVEDKVANHVAGTYEPEDALELLLADTGLEYSVTANDTILVAEEGGGPNQGKGNARAKPILMAQNQTPAPEKGSATKSDDDEDDSLQLQRISVVGSRIKGARPTSPVVTITQEEMRLSGHNNLGEVIRALPQNFGGGQNPGVASGVGGAFSNINITGGSALNLRGLGHDATLTLLNGARLPYDGWTQATDVTSIPTSAIERMEILLDGASAIYGSDAVGGVANIVLKRDYEGAELSARYGGATDSGYEQRQYTAVAGHYWGSGGFLVTGDYSKNTAIRARHRDHLSHMPNQNVTIYPAQTQKGGLLSGHQELGNVAELTLDAFYNERLEERLLQSSAATLLTENPRNDIWGISPALRFTLPSDWSLGLHGFIGRNENKGHQIRFSPTTGAQLLELKNCDCNKTEAAGIEAEGPVFATPGGVARLSIGGGYRKTGYVNVDRLIGETRTHGSNRNYYAYGEIYLPLVSQDQDFPLMERLSLNAAIRHEDYDSFGTSTTPKIGAIWGLTPGFDIKASWGKSFKTPTLVQQFQDQRLFLFPASLVGGPAGSTALVTFGGNPDLEPERAEVFTAGFVAKPEFFPGFSLEFGWFDIDYTDRVLLPIEPLSQGLTNPAFAEFVLLNPTISEQNAAFAFAGLPVGTFAGSSGNFSGGPYDPSNVIAVVFDHYTNAAAQRVRGFDLSAHYTADLFGGTFTASGNGSWLTDSTTELTSLAPELPSAGVIFWPAKFKGRIGANWSRGGLTLASNINHISGVKDTNTTPNPKGESMTTLDLVVDYLMESGPLGSMGVNLAVTNVFNQAPPFLSPVNDFRVNYDSTNYFALGRVVSATITKRF